MKLSLSVGLFLSLVVGKLDLNSSNNVVLYWGQNSFGGTHLNYLEKHEKRLRYYCEDPHIDIISIGFLIDYNPQNHKLPILNFSKHCYIESHSYFCQEISADIEYCQTEKQKTILISLGGDTSHLEFGSSSEASRFGKLIWNLFMGGSHLNRPFGKAILDGINLDIEYGSQSYYNHFLSELRSQFESQSKRKYFVTTAPQCAFPDKNLNKIMNENYVDAAFIQFYNNHCNIDKGTQFNYKTWASWAKTISYNKNIKLFLGVPASKHAAHTGYISPTQLIKTIDSIHNDSNFGGVMIWDASQNMNNLINNEPLSTHMKNHLNSLNPNAYHNKETIEVVQQPQITKKRKKCRRKHTLAI